MGIGAVLQKIHSALSRKKLSSEMVQHLEKFLKEKENVEISLANHGGDGLLREALQLCTGTIRYLQGGMTSEEWKTSEVLGPVVGSIGSNARGQRISHLATEASDLWQYSHDRNIPEALLLRKALELSQSVRRSVDAMYTPRKYRKGA